MRHWLSYVLRMVFVMGVAVTLAACGGGGAGGGSEATPTSGGGGSPVAVEIPALGDVSGLPFASGIVITGSSNIAVALKAVPNSWVAKTFTLVNSSAFDATSSPLACQYRNIAAILMGTWSLPDQALCSIKANIGSFTAGYDGNWHILATGASFPGIASKIKFKIVRSGSSNLISSFVQYSCDSTGQISYTSYTVSGSALTASLKTITSAQAPQRTSVDLAGTMDTTTPTKYTAKSGTVVYTGTRSEGALQGKINATQGVDYLLMNGFDSVGSGSNYIRLYGQADQSNTTSPLAISGYTFGAGAANAIDNGISSSGCWNSSSVSTTCSGANYTAVNGQTPLALATQTVSDFSTADGTAWDCSGTADVTATFSMGGDSCYSLYSLNSSYIDCDLATGGSLTVTPSVSSTTLSTSSGSPTSVSATPSIVITGSRAFDTSSLNSTTVALVNNSTSDSVTLTYTSWNSDGSALTVNPTLTSGQTYKLTLVGSSTAATTGTVIRAPVSSPAPADQLQSTGTYYITAQ